MDIYERIVDNLREGLIAVDLSMIVTVFNQSAEKITGMPRSRALGSSALDVMSRNRWISDVLKRTMAEEKIFSEWEGELQQRLSSAIQVSVTSTPFFDQDGFIVGAMARIEDITIIKQIKNDSARKERLAIVGTFAAGIAHEIRNPLGGIKGAAQLIRRKLNDDYELNEYSRLLVRESDRLNKILEELLGFAVPKELRLNNLNIHEVIDRSLKFVPFPDTISLTREYDPSIPPVAGDRDQLMQVFINIFKNSVEASNEKGSIKIITRMATDFHIADEGSSHQKMVSVAVQDKGSGIPVKDREKIFTPFFTTKSRGSGMGMPISLRIIKEHGGFLSLESSPGGGTSATIYLPVGKE